MSLVSVTSYLGDFAEDATVEIPFTTENSSGAAFAPSTTFESDDVKIYKNGSATQKTATDGLTLVSPFDSITGLHHLTIDTSNDTNDTGFWVAGADYTVILDPSDETIDGQIVVYILATFSIENRFVNSGTGARTITVTVDDGTDPLENATVRLTEGANTFLGTTNVSGVIVFNVDDATYDVAITKDGYTFAGTTVIVTAIASITYSMTLLVITPPADPSLSTVTVKCVDELGIIEEGVIVKAELIEIPLNSTGIAFDKAKQSATSNASGIATLTLVRLATYHIIRGTTKPTVLKVTIADTSTSTITSFIGAP